MPALVFGRFTRTTCGGVEHCAAVRLCVLLCLPALICHHIMTIKPEEACTGSGLLGLVQASSGLMCRPAQAQFEFFWEKVFLAYFCAFLNECKTLAKYPTLFLPIIYLRVACAARPCCELLHSLCQCLCLGDSPARRAVASGPLPPCACAYYCAHQPSYATTL